MNYSAATANTLYQGSTTVSDPDHGTPVDGTGSEMATMAPETSSFNSTKIPDVASNTPGMGTMLLSFGIITVIGLAVAMVRQNAVVDPSIGAHTHPCHAKRHVNLLTQMASFTYIYRIGS